MIDSAPFTFVDVPSPWGTQPERMIHLMEMIGFVEEHKNDPRLAEKLLGVLETINRARIAEEES